MRARLGLPGMAVLLLGLGGCSSICDLFAGENGQRLYGGIRNDLKVIEHPPFHAEFFAGLAVVDFPFSLAMDTALLPVTATFALLR